MGKVVYLFLLIVISLCFDASKSFAQQQIFWRTEAASGEWITGANACAEIGNANSQWWYPFFTSNEARNAPDCFGVYELVFDNNHQTSMNNSGSFIDVNKITFTVNATESRTINGQGIDLINTDPIIRNLSIAPHTFMIPIAFNGGACELNPVNGDLIFNGSIFNNNNFIDVFGNNGHTLSLGGVVQGGGGIAVKQNSVVEVSAIMTYTGGTFVEAGTFHVLNGGSIAQTSSVTISGGTFEVSAASLVLDNLTINGGKLVVNPGATLTVNNIFTSDGIVENYGSLAATFTSNGNIINDGNIAGTVTFQGATIAGSGDIETLVINNSSNVSITGAQSVGTLNFTSGKAILSNADLTVTSTISNADLNRYVVTSGSGRLVQNALGSVNYPVGPDASSYNPVELDQSGGAADFGVRVKIGLDNADGADIVEREWIIDHLSGAAPDAGVTLQWVSPGHESNTFNANDCHVARWTGTEWESFGTGAASCSGNVCSRSTVNNVTAFSPFGVGSENSLFPVELIDFFAKEHDKNSVTLNWRTATELNNDYFELQRSADGRAWATIGKIAGRGTTQQKQLSLSNQRAYARPL